MTKIVGIGKSQKSLLQGRDDGTVGNVDLGIYYNTNYYYLISTYLPSNKDLKIFSY